MFRSISRVFFVLICASGATVAMAVNEKNDTDQPISGLLCMEKECGLAYVPAVNDFSSCSGNQYTTACYGGASTYGNVKAFSCVSCPSGYTRTKKTGTTDASTSQCKFTYYECEKDECNLACFIGLPRWMDVKNANYQIMTNKTLDRVNCKCITTTLYRCKAGYYMNGPSAIVRKEGSSTLYSPPCNRCPYAQDKNLLLSYGTSDPGSNAGQSSCYMEKGDSYSHKVSDGLKTNTIGKYRLSVDCYYDQPSN